ncbi:MAG: hypothetical protein KAG19_08095, partial [Methylococcales bacterium]|nr:hypothetical protein [Methylococcales bacterium]
MINYKKTALFIVINSLLLSGCSGIGKGITEAILEKQEAEDTRMCEIWGAGFTGLKPHINNKNGKMKVLMVHGVGDHKPGYSTEFFEKLAKELDLSVTSKAHKDIKLSDPDKPDMPLGNLRINRFLNKEQTQELMFYELTWSDITAKEKEVLAYDNSGQYSFRRAEINDLLKRFSNDTGPDPIIYLGEKREDILASFTQSFCWMTYGNWDELPDDNYGTCDLPDISAIINDQYAFISHSLGSRITIDGVERITSALGNNKESENSLYQRNIRKELKKKTIPIYMMSNQLPMLQLGRKLPEITNQKKAYCTAKGSHYSERMLTNLPIIAFSDPNDILSYAIQPGFVEKYLDSRLCIDVTNININVAHLYDIFGMGQLANPMDAHIGYDTDDRVVALIAKGIGNDNTNKMVSERCRWIETID